jgi:RimJ/RimL family protein N-acetyltransferase
MGMPRHCRLAEQHASPVDVLHAAMLTHGRVVLRPVDRVDLPFLVATLNEPSVRTGILRSQPISLAEEERWFDGLYKSNTDVVFLIEEAVGRDQKSRPIGACGLHRLDFRNRTASLGIMIRGESDRGRGLGTEAAHALLNHAFDDLGCVRVELEVFPDNARAIRSYEKLGFVVEGIKRAAVFKHGAHKDLQLMSLLGHERPSARTPHESKGRKRA